MNLIPSTGDLRYSRLMREKYVRTVPSWRGLEPFKS
jgi:hypothetical protein